MFISSSYVHTTLPLSVILLQGSCFKAKLITFHQVKTSPRTTSYRYSCYRQSSHSPAIDIEMPSQLHNYPAMVWNVAQCSY